MDKKILGLKENLELLLEEGVKPKDLVKEYLKRVPEATEFKEEIENVADSLIKSLEGQPAGTTSFYEDGEIIAEEIFDGTKVQFAVWDGKKVTIMNEVNGVKPIFDDALTEGAVILPKKVSNFKSVKDLVKQIQEHIHKYVDVSENFEIFSVYFILMSWVYENFNTIPILRVLGDYGTGKSRFLDVVGRLCYKPCIVSGSLTPAPIYRMIKKWKGTIIIDEADFRDTTEYNEVVKILNCGFQTGRPVIRCKQDNPSELEFLPTFAPKLVASRYPFSDRALESRCLTEDMKETSRKDIPIILPEKFYKEQEKLREKLLMFRFKWKSRIDIEKIQNLDLGEIEPRLEQATKSFAILFANIPELMRKFKDFLKKYNQELVEQRANTAEGIIVNTIFTFKQAGRDDISALDIAESMSSNQDKISPQKVGRYLKSLGIKTTMKRIGDDTRRCIVWNQELMDKLKRKYIPLSETDATNETNETDVSSVTNVSNVTNKDI